jgi:hypothetical protein
MASSFLFIFCPFSFSLKIRVNKRVPIAFMGTADRSSRRTALLRIRAIAMASSFLFIFLPFFFFSVQAVCFAGPRQKPSRTFPTLCPRVPLIGELSNLAATSPRFCIDCKQNTP